MVTERIAEELLKGDAQPGSGGLDAHEDIAWEIHASHFAAIREDQYAGDSPAWPAGFLQSCLGHEHENAVAGGGGGALERGIFGFAQVDYLFGYAAIASACA